MSQTIYQISLIAAYIAGMVALFAPCCISYLLPAYLGNIFKERKQVLFMTLVYSLGIFTVMMPVVLGAKALSSLFFQLHDQTYIIGGLFMLVVGVLAFFGIKLPMLHFTAQKKKNSNDVVSTFTLGLFSGITSSCCAPVLIGVITLSSLAPSTLQALGVGAAYVLGIVSPLYIAAAFIHKRNILEKPLLKRKISVFSIGKRKYSIFVSNIIASAIFFSTGILTLVLTYAGMLSMPTTGSSVTKIINNVAFKITEATNIVPGINLIFVIVGAYLLYRFIKEVIERR